MKKAIILFGVSAFALGCNSDAQNTQSQQPKANTNAVTTSRDDSAIAPGHSTGKSDSYANSSNPAAPSNSGAPPGRSPGGDPIDTAKFDAEIAKAEKDLKSKPSDQAIKKVVAEAYFNRAVALTDARQYASALGDYRRAVKYNPDYEEAKTWISQITTIYKSLKKDAPEEGKEPPPLPFKKGEAKTAT